MNWPRWICDPVRHFSDAEMGEPSGDGRRRARASREATVGDRCRVAGRAHRAKPPSADAGRAPILLRSHIGSRPMTPTRDTTPASVAYLAAGPRMRASRARRACAVSLVEQWVRADGAALASTV